MRNHKQFIRERIRNNEPYRIYVDFTMDAFPAYTYFNQSKKVVCDMVIVSGDTTGDSTVAHSAAVEHNGVSG